MKNKYERKVILEQCTKCTMPIIIGILILKTYKLQNNN